MYSMMMSATLRMLSDKVGQFRDMGRPDTVVHRSLQQINHICYHHSACCGIGDTQSTLEGVLNGINNNHVRLHPQLSGRGTRISYHAIVWYDGTIVYTRPADEYGRHCSDWEINKASLGVCRIGHGDKKEPTDEQYQGLARYMLQSMRDVGKPLAMIPHSDNANKTCPGTLFDHQRLSRLIAEGVEGSREGYYEQIYREEGLTPEKIKNPTRLSEVVAPLMRAGKWEEAMDELGRYVAIGVER